MDVSDRKIFLLGGIVLFLGTGIYFISNPVSVGDTTFPKTQKKIKQFKSDVERSEGSGSEGSGSEGSGSEDKKIKQFKSDDLSDIQISSGINLSDVERSEGSGSEDKKIKNLIFYIGENIKDLDISQSSNYIIEILKKYKGTEKIEKIKSVLTEIYDYLRGETKIDDISISDMLKKIDDDLKKKYKKGLIDIMTNVINYLYKEGEIKNN